MTLHIPMQADEEGWIVVECPALPGCVSQGRTEDEAVANIKEAIEAWMLAEDEKALILLPKDRAAIQVAV